MANKGASTAHTVFRVLQVLTLIPAWALLAAIIDWYNRADQETPGSIITLFVFCILGSVWAFCILILTNRANNTALWIVFWDIVAFAGLIAGVATTSRMANTECGNNNNRQVIYITDDGRRVTADNVDVDDEDSPWRNPDNCNLLKAAWGLAIANIIMFFITAILAGVIYRQNKEADRRRDETVIVEEALPPGGVVREKVYTTTDDDGYDDYPPRRPRRSRSRRHERRDRSYDRSEYSVDRSRSRSRRTNRAASSGRGHRSSRSVPASRDGY